jgi:O-acetyl-ADP-ribose deacetylase (regulator of RNase III)
MEKIMGECRVSLRQGDITRQSTDAIVNAANSGLMGGGGVDGAIHRAGGPAILDACREIIARIGRLPAGEAVITTGGNLPARHVIHTVGPVYRGGDGGEPDTLRNAYGNSLRVAADHGLSSISFPSISTGVYRYPVADAAEVALRAVADFLKQDTSVKQVEFVLFDSGTYQAYREVLEALQP